MHSFTIRDIEHLTGIKAHTIRIWEQRYQLITPKRKQSMHRTYDGDDLKFLLRIALLYHRGFKISRIAGMTEEEKDEVILLGSKQGHSDSQINQLMEASIDLDSEAFTNVLRQLKASIGLERAITQVIYPYFEKIGLLWMTGNVIPAQEHFASNHIRNWILQHMPTASVPESAVAHRILLLCPQGEHHEIPLLFIQYLLRQEGKSAIVFGANTQIESLKTYFKKQEAEVIWVYLITHFNHLSPEAYIEELQRQFPSQQIVAAGPAFRHLQASPQVEVLHSMEEIIRYARI